LKPAGTVAFLGAGSSIPSGALSGGKLAERLWREISDREAISDDLAETASLIEREYSRRDLVEALQKILGDLEPTGGILVFPQLCWSKIYTTNYDRLIETAYRKNKIEVVVIRSNYDWHLLEQNNVTPIFKIHGCLSQDGSIGHKSSMIISERDYENHSEYKELLFSQLQTDMQSKNVLIIGQSLRDRHLRANT
jgi:hypothetical protein